MKKWLASVLAAVLLSAAMLSGSVLPVKAERPDTQAAVKAALEKAVTYLQNSGNANGSYGEDGMVKDTTQVEKLYRDLGIAGTNSWLAQQEVWDNDSLARLYCATGEDVYLEQLSAPCADGGYGLTADYTSDVLDTMLVLEALSRRKSADGSGEELLEGIYGYLSGVQNADGGFSYLPEVASDYALTVRIGLLVAWGSGEMTGVSDSSGYVADRTRNILAGVDAFVGDASWSLGVAGEFENGCYGQLYAYVRGTMEEPGALADEVVALQAGDGSYYGDMDATIAAVRLLQLLGEVNKPHLEVSDIRTELSAYTACMGYDTDISAKSVVSFDCNYDFKGIWKVELFRNGSSVQEEERVVVLGGGQDSITMEDAVKIHALAGEQYCLTLSLLADGEVVGSVTEEISVTELVVENPVLELAYLGNDTVAVSWNDISNQYCRYGYRMLRSCDGGEWETRSSWNGSEKVKVLNIYPCSAAAQHLTTWLTSKLSVEQVPAGMDLFEIGTVHIDDYNQNPDAYLKDAKGEYRYDVLYFGAYDSNAHMDLTNSSYIATQAFVDSGRGVLFGHDTVTMASDQLRVHFSKFSDQLGIKLGYGSIFIKSNQAKVVNSGMLTSYPWKLEGTLSIPTTHAYQQYTGGTNKATVWMELVNGGYYDSETGGWSNAYLFSRNQLAMIQTGHSNGKASDDERKVLANTLFYLKQLTGTTQVEDKSAYDLAAPGVCEIGEAAWEGEYLRVSVSAEDSGTEYRYAIEALPFAEDHDTLGRQSAVQAIVARSGIRGYVTCFSDSEEMCPDEVYGAVQEAAEGVLTFTEETVGESLYLHIRAVDGAGNYGEETVVALPKKSQMDCFHTGIALFGSEGIAVHGARSTVKGAMYSGENILMTGSVIGVHGTCEAAGTISGYGASVFFAGKTEQAQIQEMPRLEEAVRYQVRDAASVERLQVYQDAEMTEAAYCAQDAAMYCGKIALDGSLVCEKSINMGVSTAVLGQEKAVAVCSMEGDIAINASRFTGKGILYAPNGTVTINVADLDYQGSIIARKIVIQGSALSVDAACTPGGDE